MPVKWTKDILENAVVSNTSLAGVLRHLGFSSYSGGTSSHIRSRIEYYGISTDHFKHPCNGEASNRRLKPEEILVKGSTTRVHTRQLRRALLESGVPYVCAACGQPPEWQGKPLVLQVDHIDGDWSNNIKDNLRFLCLHCHSQTSTFRYRGRKPKQQQFTPQTCQTCKKSFLQKRRAQYCSVDCANARPRATKVVWPSNGRLAELIWETPGTEIANDLGVSLSALIKRCRRYNISTPGRGYWQKVQAKKKQI